MKEFVFKPVDAEGEDTLNTIALANHLNNWMYNSIKPFCHGKILEIGSGVGNISEYFLNDNADILLTDIREGYCGSLRDKFAGSNTLLGIETMNLVDVNFDKKFAKQFGCYDSVFALNVVEHIFDDQQAISNCYKLLRPGGQLVILVPAYQWLYNNLDIQLEHYRRYTRKRLETLFLISNFSIYHSRYFNAAGIVGWFVSGQLQHHRIIPAWQIRVYNRFVSIFKLFDKMFLNSFGLSVITVGKK